MARWISIHDFDTQRAQEAYPLYPVLRDLSGNPYAANDFTTNAGGRDTNFPVGRMMHLNTTTAQASGTAWAVPISLVAGRTYKSITLHSIGAGSALTHQWFGLLNSAGALIVTTADDTSTAWGANAEKTLSIAKVNGATASTYTVPASTTGAAGTFVQHWVYIMIAASGVPTFAGIVTSATWTGVAPKSGTTDQTSQSTPQVTDGTVVPVITGATSVPWVAVNFS
jgi:hypothetical protein